ncbi:MAG: UvrB/UvrC motif-containing protein [Victivallaceae bacterium]|nr:UvrB/UvrC motif-containing protein [Victivallaceae bacterium]
MLCNMCGKNEATIHIEEISDGESKTIHLCGECMAKHPQLGGVGVSPFNLAEIVFNLAKKPSLEKDAKKSDDAPEAAPDEVIVCPSCSWTSRELKSTGLLGCPDCYRAFAKVIEPALTAMHRGTVHTGKRPRTIGMTADDEFKIRLSALRRELNETIKAENYEQSAIIRDRIAELTGARDRIAAAPGDLS